MIDDPWSFMRYNACLWAAWEFDERKILHLETRICWSLLLVYGTSMVGYGWETKTLSENGFHRRKKPPDVKVGLE